MPPTAPGSNPTGLHLVTAVLGIGAFGVSLAAGAWLYLVQLGRPVADASPWAVPANVGLFGLFAVHHSVMARAGAKAWLVRRLPAHMERTTFVWVASLLFLLVCALWRPIPGVIWHMRGLARVAAMALQVSGLLVTLHSVRLLDVADLGGVRQVRAAMRGTPVKPHAVTEGLTRRGAYGWVRHPIYFGWLLMTFPSPTMTSGRLAFALISTAYLALAVPWEERSLLSEHGDEYRRYMDDVRWRMLPGVY